MLVEKCVYHLYTPLHLDCAVGYYAKGGVVVVSGQAGQQHSSGSGKQIYDGEQVSLAWE